MSRIRNTIRFQTPEERVLNALLLVVVLVLAVVGVFKLRDGGATAAAGAPRVERTRSELPLTGGPDRSTTTTAPATTTTTLAPDVLLRYAQAVLELQRANGGTLPATTTTTRPRGGSGTTTVAPPSGGGGFPVTPTTTRPPTATTTTTRPAPTTTTTRPPTTTTTSPAGPAALTP